MLDRLYQESVLHEVRMSLNVVRDDMTRPSVLYRPALTVDGNQWCALYGLNLQDGVAGFGDSPALAMADFDRNWHEALKSRK